MKISKFLFQHNSLEQHGQMKDLNSNLSICLLSLFNYTLSPLSMYLTATSSSVCLSLINLATPKLPEPISRTNSYRSLVCMIGTSIALYLRSLLSPSSSYLLRHPLNQKTQGALICNIAQLAIIVSYIAEFCVA